MSMNEEKRANESACTATSAPRGIVVPADVVVLLMLEQPAPRPWAKPAKKRRG
jgi:hypothetical protein